MKHNSRNSQDQIATSFRLLTGPGAITIDIGVSRPCHNFLILDMLASFPFCVLRLGRDPPHAGSRKTP